MGALPSANSFIYCAQGHELLWTPPVAEGGEPDCNECKRDMTGLGHYLCSLQLGVVSALLAGADAEGQRL